MNEILKTKGLTKVFSRKIAVDHVNMNIQKGDIYGLIGKNGAGKTTIMRMLVGLAYPTDGSIELFGERDYIKQCRKIGCAIENPALYPNLSASDNLMFYNKILGIQGRQNIDVLLKKVGLDPGLKQKVKLYSLGMKQRLALAIALIGNPEFLILDEPINGLDPMGIKDIRELILKLRDEDGMTVLISSHILGELDKIATRYGVINDGKLVEELSKEDMEKECGKYVLIRTSECEKVKQILKEKFGTQNFEDGKENVLVLHDHIDEVASINKELALEDVSVESISVESKNLEEHFMNLLEGK